VSRSATVMPTWSKRRMCDMGRILQCSSYRFSPGTDPTAASRQKSDCSELRPRCKRRSSLRRSCSWSPRRGSRSCRGGLTRANGGVLLRRTLTGRRSVCCTPSRHQASGGPARTNTTSIELNHTIVAGKDRQVSAEFLAGILGLEVALPGTESQPTRRDQPQRRRARPALLGPGRTRHGDHHSSYDSGTG